MRDLEERLRAEPHRALTSRLGVLGNANDSPTRRPGEQETEALLRTDHRVGVRRTDDALSDDGPRREERIVVVGAVSARYVDRVRTDVGRVPPSVEIGQPVLASVDLHAVV